MMGLPNQGASSADAAMDDFATSHRVSLRDADRATGRNANAGRDTFRQPDFPRRIDPPARLGMEIGIGIIRSGPQPIEPPLSPHPRPTRFCWTGLMALAPPPA